MRYYRAIIHLGYEIVNANTPFIPYPTIIVAIVNLNFKLTPEVREKTKIPMREIIFVGKRCI